MAGPPPDTTPYEQQQQQQPAQLPVPDLNSLGTVIHDPHRQSILDTVQRLARPPLASSSSNSAEGSSFVFPVSVPSRMCRDHVDSLLHTDYFVYERAVGVRLLMLIMRPEDGVSGNQVFLINAAKSVRRVVFPCPDNQSSTHHETLIDGCLVTDRGQNGAPDSLRFLCLDMLAVHGRADVAAKSLDRRLGTLDMEVIRPHRNYFRLRRTSSTALHSPSEPPSASSASSTGGNTSAAAPPPCPFVLSLQIMERSYGLVKVLDQVIPSLRHACQGLVFAPVRQPFKPGPCADTYHWIPPRAVTLLVDTVRAGDRLEPDLDPRNPFSTSDAILTDPIAFKLLARLNNDPVGRLRGVGRADLDRSTHAAWALEPPKRRFGVFAWDPVSHSGQSAAGGWRWVRWIAGEEEGVVADTIEDACRAIEEARGGVPGEVLRGKMEMIRAAWKAREASQAGAAAAAAGSRSGSTDQLTSPTAGEFAKEGGLRRRAMSYQQPVAGGASASGTPTAAPSVIPPWQQQQQQQQHGQPAAPYTGGYRPWSSSSSASQPPLSPLGSEFRIRSDSTSAPPSAAPAPIDRFKSPTSPTPTTAGLPPKPPPLTNVPPHRPRERDRDQDLGGYGAPPPMPLYLGLPRRRSVSESQEPLVSPASGRVKTWPTGESEEGNREQRSRSGSESGGAGAPRLPAKPHIASSDPSKATSAGEQQSGLLDSGPRSPTSATPTMSDYANSTAAKLRSQPAPEPVPLNLSRRRSSTGPTAAMAAAVAAASANVAATNPPNSLPSSPNPTPRSRRQSSLSIAIDTMSTDRTPAAAASSPRLPARPGSPHRPKTPTSGGRLVESPTSRGRGGRVSRLSSPNKHSPSPGRVAAVLAGDMSDTSSGVPMDLDSSMAVGFGASASPEPRRVVGKVEEEAEMEKVGEDDRDHVDKMDVDEPAPEQPPQVAELGGRNASSVDEPRPQTPPAQKPDEAPAPALASPTGAQTAATQPGSPPLDSAPVRHPSSSPLRTITIPSRSMRHALGIASPTQPETAGAAGHALTLPVVSIPAPLPPGVAVPPRAPSPPPKSQLAALLTTSSASSSPVPMPHIPTPPAPPVLLKAEPAAAAATPTAAATGGGRKRKQPVSSESSPSVPSLASTRAKRTRKASAMDVAEAAGTAGLVTSPPSVAAKPPVQLSSTAVPARGTLGPGSSYSAAAQSQSLLFASDATIQGSTTTNGRPSVTDQPGPPTPATPPPHLTINTSVAAQAQVPRIMPPLATVPAHGSTSSVPPVTQVGFSHSGSQASLPNTAKMSFAFLLNDSGDDPMDTSPDSSPVRPTPTSPQPAKLPPSASSDAPAARAMAAESAAPPSKSASRRSDFDHDMTDEDVAALLTSMQSPSNVRSGTAASSARQSRQPTPKSASSMSQPPLPAQPQQAPVGLQQQLSGRSLQSQQPAQGPPAAVARQHSASLSQPPTPRQQAFLAAAAQQQQALQQHQQQRRLSTASMSEHSQGYAPSPYVPVQGPSPYGYAPPPQPPHIGHQPLPPTQPQSLHQQPYRPPPPQVVSPKAYHFTMNPATMPGSPTAIAPPSHSPPPTAYAHDPRAQPPPPAPPGAPPAHYAPYGYHGQSHPAAAYAYGYPQMQQPPTPTHHQHPQHFQQQQAAAAVQAQYHQQLQQQQQVAQAQAQYAAAMQQQQLHVASGYPHGDPYGRRGSIPGPNPQPPLPPGYRPPPGPR